MGLYAGGGCGIRCSKWRETLCNYAERVCLLEDRAFVDGMLDFAERAITAETADACLELALIPCKKQIAICKNL